MNVYINDVDKDFKLCNRVENSLKILYFVGIVFTFILLFVSNEIICNLLITIHIFYIILFFINDLILINFAENERRKTLLANSFDTDLTNKKAIGYYNNDEKNSFKKLGVNVFESTYYTKNNIKIMNKTNIVHIILNLLLWSIMVLYMKDRNILLCITQTVFSSEILNNKFKVIYYFCNVNKIYDKFYSIFVTNKYSNTNKAEVLLYIFEYECLKSSTHILLSSKNFNKNKEQWDREWNEIKDKIK